MPFKDKEKARAYAKAYYSRPEIAERYKKYYLEHREEKLKRNKINLFNKEYKSTPISRRHLTINRKCQRRRRNGIIFYHNEKGYFWRSGKLCGDYFNYKKEAIKDAEEAFDL